MWERAKQLLDGEPAAWSPALRNAINVCVASPTPMLLWWGPALVQLHNDAAIPEIESWAEQYPSLRSAVEHVRETTETMRVGSLTLLPLFDFDHSVAGVAATCVRTTTHAGTSVRGATHPVTSDDRDVVSSVSHELRNPLSTVSTMLQVLMLKAPSKELETMSGAVQQVARIIENIVESSRLTHGRVALQRGTVELATIIHRAIELAGAPIPVHVEIKSVGCIVDADAKRLSRSLANLIANSVTTAPRGARVNVSARQRGDQVEIRISDDGGHRDPAEAAAMIESRTAAVLRLAHQNARGIVELHGGSVSLGDLPGSRPECVISLPVSVVSASERMAGVTTDGKRLLLVEDNDEGARALEAALVQRGYQVAIAHDAPIALNLAKTFQPHVVLVDLGLPVMDGWELAKRLRSLAATLPIVAVTARDQPSDFQRSAELGFAEHLVKPVDVVELDRVVRRIVP